MTSPPPEPATANGDAHLAPTPRLQIVDENKAFSADLAPYMTNEWNLLDAGFNYNVVAVFGSQSTGKSTLLNRLFHTNFQVMNESQRGQTTKGIWLARAPGLPTLVMDVEGTDGRERGEDQDFERKSSLFAIAIAEVIIINMWEHMVGLYHGANMGLLKTVLEVNLQLFQKKGSPKTHLFFVIRDHASGTPLPALCATLTADLNKIWASLNKPDGLEASQLTDFFDVTFTSLPHKRLAGEQFETDATTLRQRFVDPNNADYVFRPAYKKAVPADGFPHFAQDIWTQINANRDLDLPSQQELLAQFRCDELATVAMDAFSAGFTGLKSQVDSGTVVESLGSQLDGALYGALKPFDTQASRYHQGVYQRKRKELVDRCQTSAMVVFNAQLRNAAKRAVTIFKSGLDFKLKSKGADFYIMVESTKDEVLQFFSKTANASCMQDSTWSFEESLADLRTELDHLISSRRDEELNKLAHAAERKIQTDLPDAINDILVNPTPTMWTRVDEVFREEVESAESDLRDRAKALRITDSELDERLAALRTASITALRDVLSQATSEGALVQRLKATFEQKFRYDDQGIPRVWQPSDDIDGAYRRARELADQTLKSFVVAELPYLDTLESSTSRSLASSAFTEDLQASVVALRKPLLPPSKTATLTSRFRLEADALYMEAKRSVVSSSAHVPRWVLAVIAVLGYNEFMSIIRNPFLLLLLILMAAIGFVIYATGMAGPAQAVAMRVGKDVARQVGERVMDVTGGRGIVGTVNEFVLKPMNATLPAPETAKEEKPKSE
ncbi:root hair defective 3 GTP-binding protein [Catenaria anguillulae PL171]|uniref:Root hair defective 3 GTP-binding protein n=1 Tax=Catenaria anguillulae PL171 TaxID=765915 RepID=A0A1Y2HE81_9FUNG|nr:root hair defective 3 GTP-binding protein [Catenaria anguillulae PL171]